MKTNENKIKDEGTKKPHPSPDPTQPGKGNPGTKIPVSPDEDNDFSTPAKEINEPENPSQAPVKAPGRENNPAKTPGPDDKPLPDSPLNPPKNDPDRISPATPQNPALSSGRNTKGIGFSLIIAFLLSFQTVRADNTVNYPLNTPKTENAEVIQLYKRLENIRRIDKSELSRTEKKELRNEVKEIRKKLAEVSGGVYISAGAVIIILLLLIILT